MKIQDLRKLKMPDRPGVYFFKQGSHILYIGKATSLKDRVRSYFSNDLITTRGQHILGMTFLSDKIEWQETDSVLEALILEANLIKKHQPKYNTKEKDNKSFNYVCITREDLPKVLVFRGRALNKKDYKSVYGPFPNGSQLKEAMNIIRRIFPFIDRQSSVKNNREFYRQLKLTPENISQYKKDIRNLNLFFQGKKKSIILNLKKEMMLYAKNHEFEKAAEARNKIFALEHINDVALIKNEIFGSPTSKYPVSYRIEAYDIAHMSGKSMVGVMTVVENNHVNKNEYRKFIIRTQNASNDTGALDEVLSRRLRHIEWGLPNLIVVDGSTAQVNVAKRVTDRFLFKTPVVGVVKDERHKPKMIIGDSKVIKEHERAILLANSEAHRFAITFHKQKRGKSFLSK